MLDTPVDPSNQLICMQYNSQDHDDPLPDSSPRSIMAAPELELQDRAAFQLAIQDGMKDLDVQDASALTSLGKELASMLDEGVRG